MADETTLAALLRQPGGIGQREKNRLKLGAENADELTKQGEYNRAVAESEAAFNEGMARNKSFDKTDIGKMYEKTGGYAPFIAGTVGGALTRLGAGPGSAMTKYVAPGVMGGAAGFIAPNAPNYYNSTNTPADNPKKRAYEARGEALPPGHPRKQEFLDYAKTLPEENPVHEGALRDYTLANILKRGSMGAAEGVIGGLGAADTINFLGRSGSGIGNAVSAVGGGVKSLLGRFLRDREDPQAIGGSLAAAASGTLPEAAISSPRPTSGAMSSDPSLPSPATGRSEMARMLRDSPSPQRRLPAPEGSSNLPSWASEPPEGVKLDRGYYWDASVAQQRHEKGGFGPTAKYSAPRIKREDRPRADQPEEKLGVQIDDTKPLRYED
jgi:hypothetical protein